MNITEIAKSARSASILLAAVKTDVKNKALAEIAKALKQRNAEILAANKKDLIDAEENNLAAPLLKRLKFDENKIADVCAGIDGLIKLDDPVGDGGQSGLRVNLVHLHFDGDPAARDRRLLRSPQRERGLTSGPFGNGVSHALSIGSKATRFA